MRTRPFQRTLDQQKTPLAAGVYGSNVASQFLRDLKTGTDSVDIITLGDSNTMRGDYGYTGGWHRALNYFCGSTAYASPLYAGNLFLNGAPNGTSRSDYGWGTGTAQTWTADNYTTDRIGTYRHLVQAAAASDTNAVALKNYLGFDSTNYTDDTNTRLPKSHGWQWVGAFVPQLVSSVQNYYSSSASSNYITIGTTSELNYATGSGGSALQYRVVYGSFGTGTGQFTLGTRDLSSPNTTTYAATAQSTSAAIGYATTTLNFTTQATTLNNVRCYWDGFSATQSLQAKGPVAILWQSVIFQSKKGYAATCLIGHSGLDTTGIADRIEYMDKLLDSHLKEIIDRQKQAGGTGRAIIFLNSGINDTTPATTWTPATTRIVQRIQQRWAVAGGSLANLAFVFSVTHATTAQGAWDTGRAAAATAANAWGTTNANSNVCVVDLATNYSGYKMLNGVSGAGGSVYDSAGAGQAHLSTALTQLNGYDAMVGNVVSSLLAST